MRWVKHVASMGEVRICTQLYLQNVNGRDVLGDIGKGTRIILKLMLHK